ncbi:hypothetical protein LOK49_LG14G00363 [Camellia lanceoleosa]|uniref:Uncharacterized protein n=1 Tax=Camellia lanceoleosa TaxID=1840588 RepID=A0ACC0FBJ7_9ERIC|nr:hypothetical protein LOK49_LG14G00363 [Camellia lanceoleosa]
MRKNEFKSSTGSAKSGSARSSDEVYPSGEFEFKEFGACKKFAVKIRMLVAFPWERVPYGTVLTMKLRGQISDQLESRVYAGLSLPQICENFTKAAYDPRISGIYLHIEPLNCGWGKVQEIRRHMLDFKKSERVYLACACEELYCPPSAYFSLYGLTVQASFLGGVIEKVGIDPQAQKVGKYRSVGDQLTRNSLFGYYKIETRENSKSFTNQILYQLNRGGRMRSVIYILIVHNQSAHHNFKIHNFHLTKCITSLTKSKNFPTMCNCIKLDLHFTKRGHSMVGKWTVGLLSGKDLIAVIRASGRISRARGLNVPSSGVVGEQFIEKIRRARASSRSHKPFAPFAPFIWLLGEAKNLCLCLFKEHSSSIVRGVQANTSMFVLKKASSSLFSSSAKPEPRRKKHSSSPSWTRIFFSASSLFSVGSLPTSSRTSMSSSSISAFSGTFNLGKLYEKIGFNKEILSRGRFAELTVAEHGPFRPDEVELFAKSAQNAYKQFRDKVAYSRSMVCDCHGLNKNGVFELSRPSPTLPEILVGIGYTVVGVDRTLQELLQDLASSDEIQAQMDGIMFQKLDGVSNSSPLFTLIKDYLSSL